MRFYVPNMEEIPEKSNKDENMDGEGENSEDEVTPAKIFNDQILKRAGLGESAGEFIAQFEDLPLMVPRGKYTL
jgi:hypothetical protein